MTSLILPLQVLNIRLICIHNDCLSSHQRLFVDYVWTGAMVTGWKLCVVWLVWLGGGSVVDTVK